MLFSSPARLCASVSALVLFLATALLGAGCSSTPAASSFEYEPTEFTLVFLRTGPNPDASTEELFQGHFAFMDELAEQRLLLVAGPFGPEKAEDDLRGIFLIDEPDLEKARALGAGDPPTQAGVFRQEAVTLTTLNVIRSLPAMETARQSAREAAGEDMEKPDIRAYTILTAPNGPEAAKALLGHPAIGGVVVLMGRMGEPRKDELFAILDVDTAEEVHARLEVANTAGLEVHVSEWYGSPTIFELALAGRPPEGLETTAEAQESGAAE